MNPYGFCVTPFPTPFPRVFETPVLRKADRNLSIHKENNMKHIHPILFILITVLTVCSCRTHTHTLTSPNGELTVKIGRRADGNWTYRFLAADEVVIDTSRLGYLLANGQDLPGKSWTVTHRKQTRINGEWHPVWGKRSTVPDRYNQLTLLLEDKNSPSPIRKVNMEFRLYDDGLAFRYRLPAETGTDTAARELTQFNYATDPTAWFYNGENANYGPVKLSEVNSVRPSNVTLQMSDRLFLNMHEAFLQTGDPLRFSSRKGESMMTVASLPGENGVLRGGYESAWRVVMAGQTPGQLVDSHLLELLNPEPETDFSWVKPGVAVWDWRINGAQWDGFTYTMSYPSWVRMVDFAAEQGFRYLVLDANWYGPEFASNSDPVKGEKAHDVQRLIAYGKQKGVGIWLYLNDVGGRKYSIEETLKQYGDWGAAGVKYGFMSGTPEEKNIWTRKITRLCAENHLLVDFHDGPVHPYGQMRTWPNAVTREFCHAQLDGHHVFTPTTFCTSVFVNMVAGPLDMNNGMFDLRQGRTTRTDENQPVPSTLVSEAARTLIVFSGATILPDIPEFYRKYPALLDFLSAQKMPWKESRTLQGEIGEYIVMMRQTEDAWLVGAATNEKGRTIELPLDFLDEGTYTAQIVEDGEEAHYLTHRETLKVSRQTVTPKDKIKIKMAPGGGACLTFVRTDISRQSR